MIIVAILCLGIVAGLGLVSLIQDVWADWKSIKEERERG